jgi:hypothetical protein
MQRWLTIVLGAAAIALAGYVVAKGFAPPKAIGRAPASEEIGDAGDAGEGGALAASIEGGASAGDGGPVLLSDLLEGEPRIDSGAGATMPDGTPVPPLPVTTPRSVKFGCVLVTYAGAQPSATGQRPNARSKEDARALAEKLAATAQSDFHAAVQQGDAGSSDDVGRVKLGILEAAPEYVLFSLKEGGVGGPVDTPRGYWIVKRIE